jgi:thioredoxin 2
VSSASVILPCRSCGTLNRVPVDRLANRPLCGRCRAALAFPSAPVHATASTFDRESNDWQELLLVEFWSVTCGYCRMAEPVVRDLAAWRAGRVKVLLVDIQAELPLAQRFGVMATPTFILFRKGEQLARIDGAPREKIDLLRWVDQYLTS